ncbi:CHAT domain-containing protein [Thermomonospora echinospora]|uniref:CHAT domain-containing protein n=1 Tax=Thermomonospora echinospora TaxID=1992 RepID=UPI00190EF8DF|nr:CHAT domain-containing protein [Thermomonospora echinospora]
MAGDPLQLLPLALSRPREAMVRARALLAQSPSPLAASIAHQARGVVLRDFGDTAAALRELRTAVRLARRAGDPAREADVLATLGVALVHAGRTRPGLTALDRAVARSRGEAAARVRFRRAVVFNVLGRHEDALADLRRVIPALRRADDTLWSARAYTARGVAHLGLGSPDRADTDFRIAEMLYGGTDQEVESVFALHNRGLTAFRLGDLPAALARLDEAGRRYVELGVPMPELNIDRCSVLLSAGLPADALAEADLGIRQLERIRGQATRRSELLLMAARAALATGDPQAAVDRARTASALFSAQRRRWWSAHARLVLLQARLAAEGPSARLLHQAVGTARRLAELRSADEAQAHLLAGRVALALGRAAEADAHLATAARSRRGGPAQARSSGWLAEALRAEAAGRHRGLLGACRHGLALLEEHRLSLGASELRAQATAQGAELAALAQRAALRAGRPRELLVWSERWRATALAVPAVHPVDDQGLQAGLTAFREVSSRLERARAQGSAPLALEREQRRLERDIRSRTMHAPGASRTDGRRFDVGSLLDALGDARMVEIVDVDGALHILVCGAGQVRRYAAGRTERAAAEVEFARSALGRLAFGGGDGDLTALADAGARLQCELLGTAVRRLGDGPVVVVPPGILHGVPWALLPALRDRELNVAPSASAWLKARTAVPAEGGVVLVRGPGLHTGGGEVALLAEQYGDATVLQGGTASAARVLEAVDGCGIAHIAAHGAFRADSPLFSSLRMEDGPLTVYDFERLRRAPYRLVLSSCDSGRMAAAGADELLGLVSALLPLGTAGVVASLVAVNDEATVPLMLALHDALRAGEGLARALLRARAAVPADPVHQATALSFVALGAG